MTKKISVPLKEGHLWVTLVEDSETRSGFTVTVKEGAPTKFTEWTEVKDGTDWMYASGETVDLS